MAELHPADVSSSCDHYIRRCSLLAPCCDKYYNCRLCHNEVEDHELDRKTVQIIKCLQCNKAQKVMSRCEDCGVKFGRYYCEICRLFDDHERGQFHCSGCGICRVGGQENFFHCLKCDMCLGVQLKESHMCIEKSSRSACPICFEDIHTSRIPSHVPPCGHLLHNTCFSNLLQSGGYACPLCNTSMVDMTHVWRSLDNEIAHTPMLQDYDNFFVSILCRDCHKESKVKYHVLGLKCVECGSYNTSREGEEGIPDIPHGAADNAEWETDEEEEILGGEKREHVNHDNRETDDADVSDVVLNVTDDAACDLPLD